MSKDVARLCAVALEEMAALLPPAQVRDAHDWIHRYGECLLAVEMLIDWAGDLDLALDERQVRALEAAMRAMGQGDSQRMRWLSARHPRSGA